MSNLPEPVQAQAPRSLRVAILGCGFIGVALLSGILRATENSRHELGFFLTVHSQESLVRLQDKFDVVKQVQSIGTDNVEASKSADVVILGFQPQQVFTILSQPDLKSALVDKLIISLVAGVGVEQLSSALNGSKRISRVLPSVGAQVNESASLVSDSPLAQQDRDVVIWLFDQIGRTHVVSEKLIGSVTALSATTHALAVVAMDALVDGSVAEGVPRSVAYGVAAQCLRSSATLLQGHVTLEGFKESMSIASGITINALLELERGRVRAGISDAVRYATQYSKKMSEATE